MKFWPGAIASILVFCGASPSNAEVEDALLQERWQSSRVVDPSVLPEGEIAEVEVLLARSLDHAMDPQTEQAWAELGFETETLRLQEDPCHLLYERHDSRLGRGMFLLCPTRSRSSTLLIPHGFHDRLTAEIGMLLATEGRFRAVAWNTTPRDLSAEGEPDATSHDVAHAKESYFTGLARAASVLGIRGPIVQLHGFAPYLRTTAAGRSARAILSSGTSVPHESTLVASACLGRALGERLLVYPTEVNELGGTRNRVAAVLRDWGRRDFLHIELSFALRRRLLEDESVRQSITRCLGASPR